MTVSLKGKGKNRNQREKKKETESAMHNKRANLRGFNISVVEKQVTHVSDLAGRQFAIGRVLPVNQALWEIDGGYAVLLLTCP
jgi:hypothetical protein